jgi:cytochrome P450
MKNLTANISSACSAPGHETTVNLIGNGLLALHRNPDQLALLKANPGLITNADRGIPALTTPRCRSTGRVALEDIDDLGGKKIPKGEGRALPAGFGQPRSGGLSRPPDRLDITRPNVRRCPLAAASTSASAPSWRDRGGDRDRDPAAPAAGSAAG